MYSHPPLTGHIEKVSDHITGVTMSNVEVESSRGRNGNTAHHATPEKGVGGHNLNDAMRNHGPKLFSIFVNEISADIEIVPGDGHCLVHVVGKALGMRTSKILAGLSPHILVNVHKYKDVLPDNWVSQLDSYVKNKV